MKNLKTLGALLILAVSIVACDDDDFDNTPELQAIGDVFVRCKQVGNDTVYAPVFYTYSNFSMNKVAVEGPTDSNIDIELSKFNNKTVYRAMPSESDFTTNDITNGVYEFEITSESNQTYTINDKLIEDRLDPLSIVDFDYNSDQHTIDIEWNEVDDADVYVIKIHNEMDGDLIFVSNRTVTNKYTVVPGTNEWSDFQTVDGATYIVGVYAYKFELPSATSGYDINCESVDYREIEW